MILLHGLNLARAEMLVGPKGMVVRVHDRSNQTKTYKVDVDPLELGVMALLAIQRNVNLRAKTWMWKGELVGPEDSTQEEKEEGKGVLVRGRWFVRPVNLREPQNLSILEAEDLRKLIKNLIGQVNKRPVWVFEVEPVLTEGESYTFFVGNSELMSLVNMSHRSVLAKILDEGMRIVDGLCLVAKREDGGGFTLGIMTGSSTVQWLTEEHKTYLRGVLTRALEFERAADFTLGALKAYVGADRLRKVRAVGGNFWDVGVTVKVAKRQVTFRSPESVAALLVILGL